MRLAALLLLASPAAASDYHEWGNFNTSSVEITRSQKHAYDVIFHNTLTNTALGCPSIEQVLLEIDGNEFAITVFQECGRTPDTMTVFPPIGYAAFPQTIIVQEEDFGIIQIHQELLG